MTTPTLPKHYAKYHRDEYVILGFNQADGSCLLCAVNSLPVGEQQQLRQIASSAVGQSTDYLIPILRKERHPSGSDWFTYLGNRMRRQDGSVIRLPLKELEDMNTDQKGVFKGYKKPAKGTADAATVELGDDDQDDVSTAKASGLEKKLDALVDASKQTQDLLSQLAQLMIQNQGPASPVKPARATKAKAAVAVKKKPGRKPKAVVQAEATA
jgi:hypothetical protein